MPAASIIILAHVMIIIYALIIKKNICQKYNTGESLWGNIWTFHPSTAEERMSFVDWNRTFLWSLILFSQSQWKWLAPKSFWREALKIQKEIKVTLSNLKGVEEEPLEDRWLPHFSVSHHNQPESLTILGERSACKKYKRKEWK